MMTGAGIDVAGAVASLRRTPAWTPVATGPDASPMPAPDALIPHRPPFLLIDRLLAWDPGRIMVVAERWVDPDDPVLAGHFPGAPIYPGSLQGEVVAQTALCMLHLASGAPGKPRRMLTTRVFGAQYLAPVYPGDLMQIEVSMLDDNGLAAVIAGRVIVTGQVRSTLVMEACRV